MLRFALSFFFCFWFNYALAKPSVMPEAQDNDMDYMDYEMQALTHQLVEQNANLQFYEKILHRVLERGQPEEQEIQLLQDQISNAYANVMHLEKSIEAARQKWIAEGNAVPSNAGAEAASSADDRHHHSHHGHSHHHPPLHGGHHFNNQHIA